MTQFLYIGKQKGKAIEGVVEEKNKKLAITTLRRQYILVDKIKTAKKKDLEKHGIRDKSLLIAFGPFGKVGHKDLMQFTKKIATMVRSGLGLIDTLEMVSKQTKNEVFKRAQEDILDDLAQGVNLVEAFSRHPKIFDNIYINMLAAGEATGELDRFLDRLATMLEKRHKIVAGIKKALFYPITLIVVALSITVFMLTNVVPTFEKMYANLGVELPGPTQAIVGASRFLLDPVNAIAIIISVFVFLTVFKTLKKRVYLFSKAMDALLLKLPLFGGIAMKGIVARITLLMANLATAGVSIVEVIEISKSTTNNKLYIEAMERIKEGLYDGRSISEMFENEKVFPVEVTQFISVGERSGNIDEMLESLSKFYEEEFDVVVDGLSTVIEPLMIVVVGGLIGSLVIALYLPIFSAGDLVG
jgi:type IV pilus assembly protein PilC